MDFAVIGNDKIPAKGAYDPFFGIKISNPKVTLEVFNVYCGNLKKMKLKALTANQEDPNFVTMGVVVQSSGTMKSAKNADYVIWAVDDLLEDRKVRILLFGEAAGAHWKVQTGSVVALTHLQVLNNDGQDKNSMLAFKAIKDIQVISLGFCPDYAICEGIKKDGSRCTNYVNKSVTPNCDYHIQQAAKKFRSQRGAFSAISNERPKCAIPKEPRPFITKPEDHGDVRVVKRDQPCTSKITMRPGDRALMAKKARLGQRVLTALAESQAKAEKEDEKDKKPEPASMRAFLAGKTRDERFRQAILKAGSPQLGRTTQRGQIADLTSPKKPIQIKRPLHQKESEARLKAAEIFKASLNKTGKVDGRTAQKRKAQNDEENVPLAKKQVLLATEETTTAKSNVDERIKRLLARKSTHQKEVDQEVQERESRYFKQKEVEEKVEGRLTSLMEMKDVNVVTCKVCDYTAPNPGEMCQQLCHELVRHKARKRWFKCKECQARAIVYTMLPTKPCISCGAKNYERVAMKDERKVELRPKLEVRGEERKFV